MKKFTGSFIWGFYMGVSPSGKATDFDSVIGGPTPPTPASPWILQMNVCRIFAWGKWGQLTAYILSRRSLAALYGTGPRQNDLSGRKSRNTGFMRIAR